MTVGEVERGEALLVIAALLRDMDLREGKTCDRSDAQSRKDERISGREPRVAIRDDLLGAAGKKDGERLRRECDLRECLPAPRMPRGQGKLDELYRHLFRVVREGFHDIALMIDHRELLRCKRQKRALKEDGIMVNQQGSPFYAEDAHAMQRSHKRIASTFQISRVYQAHIPTFAAGYWLFGFASKKYHPVDDLDAEAWNALNLRTRYYTTRLHKGAFYLPAFLEDMLKEVEE